MWSAILRGARTLFGQLIGLGLEYVSNVQIPFAGVSIGVAISMLFKWLRNKYPDNKFLEWLPL